MLLAAVTGVAPGFYSACVAVGATGAVVWLAASVWVVWACHMVTRTAPFHPGGGRGEHSPWGRWLRGRGVNVGYCILLYARLEACCAVLMASGIAAAVAGAVWDCTGRARQVAGPVVVGSTVFPGSGSLADDTDLSATLISAVVTAATAVAYFAWRAVARVRMAHGGLVPFAVRRIGAVITGAIRWHIDTTWTYLTLKYFAVSDVDHLKDGRPIFDGVDMVRHRYGVHSDECYNYIFPCEGRHSAKLLRESGVAFRDLGRVALNEQPLAVSLGAPGRCRPQAGTDTTTSNNNNSGAKANFPVAYFHGGGFVAANACVLTQSVVPVARGGARGGFEIYAADYPMGQDGAFPMPVLSGLKLLRHMRQQRGVSACHIYGDSAGACVAAYVAVLVCNPPVLRRFQLAVRAHHAAAAREGRALPFGLDDYGDVLSAAALAPWWFPRVVTCLSVYGVLDDASWREPPGYVAAGGGGDAPSGGGGGVDHSGGRGGDSAAVGSTVDADGVRVCLGTAEFKAYASGLGFVVDLVYLPPTAAERRCYSGLGFFIADILQELDGSRRASSGGEGDDGHGGPTSVLFPPCLLVCGNRDALLLSSLRLFKQLDTRGQVAGLLEADARHAFVGVPPCLMTDAIATPEAVAAADTAIIEFLESDGQRFSAGTRLTTEAAAAAANATTTRTTATAAGAAVRKGRQQRR